ncbi:hypothetical protein [Mesorhizobium loti]|uniref:hypothetical protein n=1 Tax=Rhizobium loti TaxID=381 RepID=UPI001FDA1496|nr:hypothetical protein [Mesorhizobium loti]
MEDETGPNGYAAGRPLMSRTRSTPEVTWEFDTDQDQARESRLRLLAFAADDNHFVAGAHLDSPGIGRVVRFRGSFRYEAL